MKYLHGVDRFMEVMLCCVGETSVSVKNAMYLRVIQDLTTANHYRNLKAEVNHCRKKVNYPSGPNAKNFASCAVVVKKENSEKYTSIRLKHLASTIQQL